MDDLFGAPVLLDFRFHVPDQVIEALRLARFHVVEEVEREPYGGAEYPSRRCYLLASAGEKGNLPMSTRSTRISRHVNAPRADVYRALLDARAVATWMVPAGMTSHVHEFDPREGGLFRISLTYDEPTGTGKSTEHTDTYHGHFVKLVPDEQVVEVMEFETADDAMRGEMTVTFTLVDADGGTDVLAVHDNLPPGLSPADNETGWRMSLDKLAAFVEGRDER